MSGPALPAGYELVRERVTWTRWDPAARRNRISHPVLVTLTEPDGNKRTFDTVADAHEWLADPDNVMTPDAETEMTFTPRRHIPGCEHCAAADQAARDVLAFDTPRRHGGSCARRP